MRILIVVNSLIYGGAETQVIAISRELALRGHSVLIHTLRADNPRKVDLEGSAVQVVAGQKKRKLDLSVIRGIRQTIRRFDADIVHGFLVDGNLHARLAAAGTGVPALNSERNDAYPVPLQHRLALTLTRRLAAGVVANSHAGARFAQRLFRLPDERVHVVWNGVDIDAVNASAVGGSGPAIPVLDEPGVNVACLVGMMRPQKDHVLALKVAAALVRRDPAWRLLCVGDSLPHTVAYKQRVMRASKELGLDRFVSFAGVRRNVAEIVRRSTVLLSTSLFEGCPNVVIEAMAVGTPVVSTEYSDIRMILPNAWQVVASREPERLADAVLRAAALREAVARAQRIWVEDHGTLSHSVDEIEAIYRQYAARRRNYGCANPSPVNEMETT